MPLAPCARCKKLFNKSDAPICPVCEPAENEDIEKVRDIIEEHPNFTAEQVAEVSEVDLAVVSRMLDRGVVAIVSATDKATCGRCGAPAISMAKRLCEPCLEKMNADVAKAQAQAQAKMAQESRKAPEIGKYNVRDSFEDKRR